MKTGKQSQTVCGGGSRFLGLCVLPETSRGGCVATTFPSSLLFLINDKLHSATFSSPSPA